MVISRVAPWLGSLVRDAVVWAVAANGTWTNGSTSRLSQIIADLIIAAAMFVRVAAGHLRVRSFGCC